VDFAKKSIIFRRKKLLWRQIAAAFQKRRRLKETYPQNS
jgi:hypothetical protein